MYIKELEKRVKEPEFKVELSQILSEYPLIASAFFRYINKERTKLNNSEIDYVINQAQTEELVAELLLSILKLDERKEQIKQLEKLVQYKNFLTITFENRNEETKGLRLILGKYAGRILGPRRHQLPKQAVAFLIAAGVNFEITNPNENTSSFYASFDS